METQFVQFSGSMSPTPINPNKVPKALIVKIVIGIAVVGIVGGVLLGARIWDPLWNPFRPDPEDVLEEMFEKMKEVKTSHSEMTINMVMEDEKTREIFNIDMILETDSDATDSENPKGANSFDISIKGEIVEETISLTGETKSIGDDSYIKFDTLPDEFMMFYGDLSQIKRQWIKYGQETSEEEEMFETFGDSKIYYVKEELKDEKINKKKMYHYIVALDNEELKDAISEATEVMMESSGMSSGGFESAAAAGAMAGMVDEFLDEIGEISADFWIGKKDLLLYKVELEKEIDVSAIEEGAEEKLTIKFVMENSDYDKPVTIEAPEDFEDIGAIKGILEGISSPFTVSRQQSSDARIISDMSQIRAAAEMIYYNNNDSYLNVNCQNENMIKAICDDIRQFAGTNPTIYQSKDKYCAYVELATQYGYQYYYCIDSEMNANKTEINPGGMGYCNGKTVVCSPATKTSTGKPIVKKPDSFLLQASLGEALLKALK